MLQYGTQPAGPAVTEACEKLRGELSDKWLSQPACESWSPKCDIVLHASDAAYVQAVGAGGATTVASSLVDQKSGKISLRRIDVRATDPDWQTAALPHELTHVVLADRFAGQRLPRWADEGLAILADPAEKRTGHYRDLQRAVAGRQAFRVVELLTLEDYPAANRWATFYGQSASVAEFLISRGTSSQFVDFVKSANELGYETALRNTYNIGGMAELERQWNQHLKSAAPINGVASVSTQPAAALTP